MFKMLAIVPNDLKATVTFYNEDGKGDPLTTQSVAYTNYGDKKVTAHNEEKKAPSTAKGQNNLTN